MTPLQKALCRNMKSNRKSLGYSQKKLAELCEVTTSFIGEIEIGRKFPSAGTLQKIADSLGVKPYQLFLDENDKKEWDRGETLNRFTEEIKESFNQDLTQILKKYL